MQDTIIDKLRVLARCATVSFACLFAIATVGNAYAFTARLKGMDEAYREADLVWDVRVRSVTPHFVGHSQCGVLYRASLLHILKSGTHRMGAVGGTVTFGRSPGLQIGSEYLLFLRYVSDARAELRSVERDMQSIFLDRDRRTIPEKDGLAIIRCGGIIPGIQFDNNMAWRVQYGQVYAFGLWPRSAIPRSVRVDYADGPNWMFRADDVFSHLSGLSEKPTSKH